VTIGRAVLSALATLCAIGWGIAAPLPPAGELIRGIYADPGPAINSSVWAGYGGGYALDKGEAHSGATSLRCSNATGAEAHGGSQQVVFDQQMARPLVISGWAKLEGVSGPPSYKCSVYLDLRLTNGESWYMQTAEFDPAKTGWQYAERVCDPPAAIATASVHVFLRETQGTAWFDDLHVGYLLEDGTRSPNLLKSPGFEPEEQAGPTPRDAFFSALEEIGCNAVHVYRGVDWKTAMAPAGTVPIAPDDPVLGFVQAAHQRGLKVWLTVGVGLPEMSGPDSPDFPVYGCVNERWGQAYTGAVAHMAAYGVDGVGVVPDEWNYNSTPVDGLRKHANADIAAFYEKLPGWCNCPTCQERFTKAYGAPYPDVSQAWSTADPVWAKFTQFRYDSTRAWIDRTVRAASGANPKVITDTMICVLPVCSDDRLSTGAAWDQIGATTDLGCLQTDPYIFLHNYLGDSTHLYPTETALHLGAANFRARSGVTLEACRLYDLYRDKDPVDTYGAALSCWVHGASEFFWWHMNYMLGREPFVDAERAKSGVRSVYEVMKAMEPYLAGGEVPHRLLVCYSRRSEDTWDWLSRAGATDRAAASAAGAKRGFIAHRNVLYTLLRRACPFGMTFLENPDPAKLERARVLVVPFAYALSQDEADLLRREAEAGKTVVLMGEFSPVDEVGQPLPRPRLVGWFDAPVDPAREEPVERAIGRGRVVYLGGDPAVGLFAPWPPQRDPAKAVRLPDFAAAPVERLMSVIEAGLGRPASLFEAQPSQDVEATLLSSPAADVVLAINWDTRRTASVGLRLPIENRTRRAVGRRVLPDGTVAPISRVLGNRVALELEPQEAQLLALPR